MKTKLRIGFLLKSTNGNFAIWECFSGLYQYLSNDSRFDCHVFICPDFNWEDRTLEASTLGAELMLAAEDVPFKLLDQPTSRLEEIRKAHCDFLLITSNSPSYAEYSPGINFRELRKMVKLIYIPYGAVIIGDDPRKEGKSWHAKGRNELNSSCIFVDAEPLANILKTNGYDPRAIQSLGHLKLYSMQQIYREKVNALKPEKNKFKLKVLVGQHHSINSNWISNWNFGTFDQSHRILIELARENSEIQFNFNPHPLLQMAFDQMFGGGAFHAWLKTFLSFENCKYEPNRLTAELFAESDLLITDGISYLTEYPVVAGKPVLFIENPKHNSFNELGELGRKYALCLAQMSQADEYLKNFMVPEYYHACLQEKLSIRHQLLAAFLPEKENIYRLVANILIEDKGQPPAKQMLNKYDFQFRLLKSKIMAVVLSKADLELTINGDLNSSFLLFLLGSELSSTGRTPRVRIYIDAPTELNLNRAQRVLEIAKKSFPDIDFDIRILEKSPERPIFHRDFNPSSLFKDLNEIQWVERAIELELYALLEICFSCEGFSNCRKCKGCNEKYSLLGKLNMTEFEAPSLIELE